MMSKRVQLHEFFMSDTFTENNENLNLLSVYIPERGRHHAFKIKHINAMQRRIQQLETERDALQVAFRKAHYWMHGVHSNIYSDDSGDLMCEFEGDEVLHLKEFLDSTADMIQGGE
jgi:hypothetical protein